MGSLAKIFSAGNLHPRENYRAAATLALNGELIIECEGCSWFLLNLRGTFTSATIEVSGCSTVDGAIYTPIPLVPVNTNSRVAVIAAAGSVQGLWEGGCAGYYKIRARCTALSTGSVRVNLVASNGNPDTSKDRAITPLLVTVTAAAGAAATLTLPAVTGLKHYLTYLRIVKFAAATLTPAATPVIITTTNIPGALAFSLPADAAAQGTVFPYQEDFAAPIVTTSQGTNTTVVAPATPNIIWRLTGGYYLAP